MYDFQNRVLLLTGANGGIGREVAKLFYAHGAQLVLTDLDHDALKRFATELDPTGTRIATIRMDASDPKDSEAAVELAVKRCGGIDFLVPAAAIYLARPAKEMSDAEWHKVISINLDGVFYICQRSIRALRDNSAICNIASVAGHRGSFANSHYSATKGAILSLTRSLARELGPRTRVNAVSPGIIETPMTTELIKLRGADSIEQSSLKRLGQPAEVATAIAFLCSSGASFITGESLQVNGGLHIS